MQLRIEPLNLLFHVPFAISHGTRDHTQAVFLELEEDGLCGYGEAALPPYLHETQASVSSFIHAHRDKVRDFMRDRGALMEWMQVEHPDPAAKACIEMAIYDWMSKKDKCSLHDLLGIKGGKSPLCSLTIGAGTYEAMEESIVAHPQFKLFKLKLNGINDLERVRKARSLTNCPLAVDVNGAWENCAQAVPLIRSMADLGVILIEQPFGRSSESQYSQLKTKSPLPVIADESIRNYRELQEHHRSFHGVNIKLMKCPGLSEALRMIHFCSEKGIKVMVGCMSESSCGVGAAASLGSLADWLDLDGPLLIKNDPFEGISYANGKLEVLGKTGIGVIKR